MPRPGIRDQGPGAREQRQQTRDHEPEPQTITKNLGSKNHIIGHPYTAPKFRGHADTPPPPPPLH